MHLGDKRLGAALVCSLMLSCTGQIQEGTNPSGRPNGPNSGPDPAEDPEPPSLATGREFECGSDGAHPGPSVPRRLTTVELVRTLRDGLGVDLSEAVAELVPGDLRAEGFSNTGPAQVTSLEHIEAYEQLANRAHASMPNFSDFVSGLTTCTDTNGACESEFVEALGRRLFRGPVGADEVDTYSRLFRTAEEEGDGFEEGAELVLKAMLQAPRFLYRLESSGADTAQEPVDPYEMAARISYLVWLSAPDPLLVDAAESGRLETKTGIETEVRRMLEHPSAREASLAYLSDWLDLGRMDRLNPNPEQFPNWTAGLAARMKSETLRFFEMLLWEEERPLTDLLNAQTTWVEQELAAFYGFSEPREGTHAYDLSSIPERGGILTQASVLTVGGSRASLVEKGLFILETLLCDHVDSPPVDVVMTMGEVMPGATQRTYSEQRSQNPACAGCHQQMDPLAYGLERFDGVGTYAERDAFGNELRSDGALVVPGVAEPQPFATIAEMMDLLAGNERVSDCFVLKSTQFALGRPLQPVDGCTLAQIRETFRASEGTYQDLMVAIATSDSFGIRRQE